ncbi:MAG: hypothetical protein ACXABY_31330 [Candidatus Thorarchaeota archaeon]|jgi:hypothetical protein
MRNRPLMKCGHTASANTDTDRPVCASCYGITPGADVIDPNAPDLTGRRSRCTYCKSIVDSSYALPFFEHRGEGSYQALHACKDCGYYDVAHGNKDHKTICANFAPRGGMEFDNHYDGCRGWD